MEVTTINLRFYTNVHFQTLATRGQQVMTKRAHLVTYFTYPINVCVVSRLLLLTDKSKIRLRVVGAPSLLTSECVTQSLQYRDMSSDEIL